MAIAAGTYKLGPDNATLHVETGRSGAAARAGHDLVIEVRSWEATLEVGERSSLALSADPTSLYVRDGKGGLQALEEKDKSDIRKTIDKDILQQKPIAFTSSRVEVSEHGLTISGTLEMGGGSKPITFTLSESNGTLAGATELDQTDWGIKQYSALFGALKVNKEVRIVVEARLG